METQSNISNIFIFVLAPYPPGKIKIVDINSTSVTLSWVAPELETGPTNYIVTAFDNITSQLNGSCETQGYQHIKECYSNQLNKLHLLILLLLI